MFNLKSDLTIKVLGYYFLNPQARHYVRELAEILKVDPGNLSRKMSELKQEGLFLVEAEGKNKYFILNKKFSLLAEYKSIYELKFGLVETLKKRFKKIADLQEAYIFGSYAKGQFQELSDIDILIVGDHSFKEVLKIIVPLEKTLGREINLIDYSVADFKAKKKEKDDFLTQVFNGRVIKLV